MKKYKYKLIIKPVFSLDEKSITIFHSSNINLFDVKNKNLSKNKLKTLKNKFDKEVKATFNDPFLILLHIHMKTEQGMAYRYL